MAMSKQDRKLKCTVEALEDRQLLTVTTTLLSGGVLQITGDSSAEQVNITQNDSTNELMVSWNQLAGSLQGDPMPPLVYQSSAMQRIVVKMGGGDDRVNYLLSNNQMIYAKTLSIDLGAGNDTALLDFGGDLIVANDPGDPRDINGDGQLDYPLDWQMPVAADLSVNLTIDVQGGEGNDTIDGIFGNVEKNLIYRAAGGNGDDHLTVQNAGFSAAGSVVLYDLNGGAGQDQLWVDLGNRGIAAGSRMAVWERGGAGNDTMNISANIPNYGLLSLNQLGGAGNDVTKIEALMDWQSTGRVVARSSGEAGNDEMTLRVERAAIPPYIQLFAPMADMKVDAIVNGGTGRNMTWITPNVRTFMARVMKKTWELTD